ncbi:hypothetical protein OUZ56_030288 [Daphnia magna]|uniref:Uncharacterized protein n=1 Tax=Daphnia magna TaxID=35525 RepID=A0ABQ9ZQV4_9CRUS|nr:hypothetical protein OUZ56_030288 [Daphnia magna]
MSDTWPTMEIKEHLTEDCFCFTTSTSKKVTSPVVPICSWAGTNSSKDCRSWNADQLSVGGNLLDRA